MDMVTRAHGSDAVPAGRVSPVRSYNEWDPLEEVIVGRLEGAVIPSDHPVVTCNIPGMAARAQSLLAGFRYPQIMIEPAQRDGAIGQELGVVASDLERPIIGAKRLRRPIELEQGVAAIAQCIEVIGIGTHVSRGMKRGSVVDIESTVHSIQRAVEEAEAGPVESIETHPPDAEQPAEFANPPSNVDLETSEALPVQKPDPGKS